MTKTRVPRQHGAHRPEHKGLHRFTDWYREHTGIPFRPSLRREAEADTEVMPSLGAFIAPLGDRIAEIEAFGGVHVTIDPHFMPEECEWCLIERRLATVRVYGNPTEGNLDNPLTVVETCQQCAVNPRTGPIRQAQIEQQPHTGDIRVEVSE